jgi:hypothetical protein
MEPMSESSVGLIGFAVIAVAIVGIVLGFTWIRWIGRNPEDRSDPWRSHRR